MTSDDIKVFYVKNKFFLIKMLKFSFLIMLILVSFFEFFISKFGIWIDLNPERCIPEYSVYLVRKNTENQIEKGDIVTFKTHEAIKFYQIQSYFGKYVAAKEGDRVEINEKGVFVNKEHLLSTFNLINKLGIEQEQLYRTITLNAKEYFVIGKTKNSYDSRYWGVIEQSQIIGKAVPLW